MNNQITFHGVDAMVIYILNDKQVLNRINDVTKTFNSKAEENKQFFQMCNYIKEDIIKNIIIQILLIFENKKPEEISIENGNLEQFIPIFEKYYWKYSQEYLEDFLKKYKQSFSLLFVEKLYT